MVSDLQTDWNGRNIFKNTLRPDQFAFCRSPTNPWRPIQRAKHKGGSEVLQTFPPSSKRSYERVNRPISTRVLMECLLITNWQIVSISIWKRTSQVGNLVWQSIFCSKNQMRHGFFIGEPRAPGAPAIRKRFQSGRTDTFSIESTPYFHYSEPNGILFCCLR